MSPRTMGIDAAVHDYVVRVGVDEPEVCRRCRELTEPRSDGRMQISPEQGQLMDWLVRALGVRRAIEVGTFTGYSSLRVALAMPADGRLVCCDVDPDATAVAQALWAQAGVADRVELRLGPAALTLRALLTEAGAWDLMFIDADKTGYPTYIELAWELLRPGGVVLVDNVLWSGRVIDATDATPDTVALRTLNAALVGDARWDRVMLPIGDGLTLLRKRG
ncbi:MAG TPA: class I SAM-dependent methyltransferase [Myxococcota bacterium]|nr:class I SAM-dependent methyltransferase [Myxococcota bacterium]